jgi:uncharacterized phage protein gp47/JayE
VEAVLQDALYQLNNLLRKPATRSVTPGLVTLSATTTLPMGSLASVTGQPTVVFRTKAAVTSTTAGQYPVDFECTTTGPVQCNDGTLTVIAGAVGGWNAVTNTADAVPGRNVETDTQFRIRRRSSIQTGGSPVGAVEKALLAISGIHTVEVFENLTDEVDASGNPPHSVEVLIFDGAVPTVSNDVIAQTIWNSVAGGATRVGNTSGNAVDVNSVSRNVPFTRPVDQNLYVSCTVTTVGTVPANASTLLATLLADQGNADFAPGATVVALDLKSILYDARKELGYTWLYDVPVLKFGTGASPTNQANLPMTIRQLPVLDTSRITFTFVPK